MRLRHSLLPIVSLIAATASGCGASKSAADKSARFYREIVGGPSMDYDQFGSPPHFEGTVAPGRVHASIIGGSHCMWWAHVDVLLVADSSRTIAYGRASSCICDDAEMSAVLQLRTESGAKIVGQSALPWVEAATEHYGLNRYSARSRPDGSREGAAWEIVRVFVRFDERIDERPISARLAAGFGDCMFGAERSDTVDFDPDAPYTLPYRPLLWP